jgi:DNA-binding LytR/AlgR family response regulator
MVLMKPLRVAVAEDEPANLRRLARLLTDCGCEIRASFGDGLAMEEWLATGPEVDALFLDIQMPELDGLSLRASIRPDLPVVFVTAHAEHAVDAFTLEAVDFLLKPVTTERLAKSLARIRKLLSQQGDPGNEPPQATRYPVLGEGAVVLQELARTDYFEVDPQGVWAWVDGHRLRTRWRTLGEVETTFTEAGLLRIHRNLLVRLDAVRSVRASGGGNRVTVLMTGGAQLEASRSATVKLKARLGL